MRAAIRIFRKDVRRLRAPLGIFVGLMVLFAWLEARVPRRTELDNFLLPCQILLFVAACYLCVTAVHQEAAAGDRQYWLTRPISWQSALAAKALFVAVFFSLPVFVANLAALLANGLSPFAYAGALLSKQWFLAVFLILPALAMASITRNFGQCTLWIFAAFAAILLAGLELTGLSTGRPWGGFAWIRDSGISLFLLAALAGLLCRQYARRLTPQSQAALAGVVVAGALLPALNLWHPVFAMESRGNGPVQVRFDPGRDAAGGRGIRARDYPGDDLVRLVLPVQVHGIAMGTELLSERVAVTAAANGESWSSGWTDYGGTLQTTGDNTLLPADGDYWQYVYLDRGFFERHRHAPVRLQTAAAFTLLSDSRTTRLKPPTDAFWVPDFGFCKTRANPASISNSIRGAVAVTCLAPFQQGQWVRIGMQSRRTGIYEDSRRSGTLQNLATREERSYAPYPTEFDASIWKLFGTGALVSDPSDMDVVLESRRAEAHFERTVTVPAIRLADYLDRPAGGAR